SHGAAKARGSPAMTAISSTGWSAESRYTAPERACTSSIIAASDSDSSGRPTGARTPDGPCAEDCPSDTPPTSSPGPAPRRGPHSPPYGVLAHDERRGKAAGCLGGAGRRPRPASLAHPPVTPGPAP